MADTKTDRVIEMACKKARGLFDRQWTRDGMRLPLHPQTALLHLHQARVRPETDKDGVLQLILHLELFTEEQLDDVPDLTSLGEDFIAYGSEGKYVDAQGRAVVCMSREKPVMPPYFYRLEPTIPEGMREKPGKAGPRLNSIAESHRRYHHVKKIEVSCHDLFRAADSESSELIQLEPESHFGAKFVQRRETKDGIELWIGRPPYGWGHLDPDSDGHIFPKEKDNGVVACLTAESFDNLRVLIERVVGPHFAEHSALYGG